MNSGNIVYSNLEELSKTNYQLTEGQTDIKGWEVSSENGESLGKVRDLLFDPEHKVVRYIILELANLGEDLDEKGVLIPIGIANLEEEKKEVILPDFHRDQFRVMPQYIIGEVTHETENKIRAAIGSPAALRMEDEIVEIDRENFYRHHHFDKGYLAGSNGESQNSQTFNSNQGSDRIGGEK